MNRSMTRLASLASTLLMMSWLTGCINLGPDYHTPDVVTAPDWLEANDPLLGGGPEVDPRWWQTAFHDPVLDRLVETALAQNLTLRSAGLRVLQSQQQLAIAIGNQFPQQQQATGSVSRQKENAITFNNNSLGLNLVWEVDFWGRFRRQVESAAALLDANVASYDAAMVSLLSQVAQTYILIQTYEARIEAARFNIELQEESFRIASSKFEAGEVSELDVSQADSLLNNTRATLPGLQISLQQLKNSLATLLGMPPQEMREQLGLIADIPSAPPQVALGMPQDLLRRRPDIRIAERQLAAQSAQIGVAITELVPNFSIGGSIGTTASNSGDLFENNSETWRLFGLFEWNILNYGRLQSNVRLQDAYFQQLLVDYRNTVLQAQGDVENAIVAYLRSHQQLAAYRNAAEASKRAVNIAIIRYQQGEENFNTLINTLAANVQQEDLLASTRGSVATNLVQVYRALGGGWEIRGQQDPVDLLPAATKDEMRERTWLWLDALE
jgi:NodT family efflux transporter outer membrane factor (OMF) lipoprotein